MVQAESDPIAERRERLRALRVVAELASADQGDEEPEKQPPDTTAAEQQKEEIRPHREHCTHKAKLRFLKRCCKEV